MAQALEGWTGYIVLVFVIAQFINMFSYTNLGMIIAVKSAEPCRQQALPAFR